MKNMISITPTVIRVMAALFLVLPCTGGAAELARRVISLDGTWDVGEGKMDAPPESFGHKVPVPGLVDLATPPFADPGPKVADRSSIPQKDPKRDAFWYRRSFKLDGPVPAMATLKIGKAMYGTRVILNGTPLGDHLPCFTPDIVIATSALQAGDNEILIRVGADRDALNGKAQSAPDGEKSRYIPGIYDSVELILSGTPNIMNVQAVPDIDKKSVTVHSWLRYSGSPTVEKLHVTVREISTQRVAGEADCEIPADASNYEHTGNVNVRLSGCHLWSPEDPFLYEVEVKGTADVYTTRFGMRSFRLDPATGHAVLNGKPYFMRGSNITIHRFFEDPERGSLPWNEEWVRKMHKSFKGMHWNSLRYSIGFPPEIWYRIADEEGILIQDEFPIWYCMAKPGQVEEDELVNEYREWMRERWNHPCVVLWDACNETASPEIGKAIRRVRGLDFSKRPWDNGWSAPDDPGDSTEAHPYHFIFGPNQPFRLSQITDYPNCLFIAQPFPEDRAKRKNPIIINEYGGLWLNRDGTPTTLSLPVYNYLLGPNADKAKLRQTYARDMAAITEFFRAHRRAAAVMQFSALGYSRPDGQTSDNWADLKELKWDPDYYTYVRDSFAPVGVMLDVWAEELPGGSTQDFPVIVTNDLNEPWHEAVQLQITKGGKKIFDKLLPAKVAALETTRIVFSVPIPQEPGDYQAEVILRDTPAGRVRSLRDFSVVSPEVLKVRGLAYGKHVKASSSAHLDDWFLYAPEFAVDEMPNTWWKSLGADPQWLAVDLGETMQISHVELVWSGAYGKNYAIQVSNDGEHWKDVFKSSAGMGGTENLRFEPVKTRWVRYYGIKAASANGHSLREFRVFP